MLLRPLLPDSVLVSEIDPHAVDLEDLRSEERRQVERAIVARQREYGAGRLLARELIGRLDIDPGPFLDGADGAPQWPSGLVGSITHCPTLCSVAVAREADLLALGIDIEEASPLNSGSERVVMQCGDRAAMAQLSHDLGSLAGKLVFSAKESAYKAVYPIIRRFLEFSDVVIRDIGNGTFTPLIRSPGSTPGLPPLQGRYRVVGGLIATSVTIEPRGLV